MEKQHGDSAQTAKLLVSANTLLKELRNQMGNGAGKDTLLSLNLPASPKLSSEVQVQCSEQLRTLIVVTRQALVRITPFTDSLRMAAEAVQACENQRQALLNRQGRCATRLENLETGRSSVDAASIQRPLMDEEQERMRARRVQDMRNLQIQIADIAEKIAAIGEPIVEALRAKDTAAAALVAECDAVLPEIAASIERSQTLLNEVCNAARVQQMRERANREATKRAEQERRKQERREKASEDAKRAGERAEQERMERVRKKNTEEGAKRAKNRREENQRQPSLSQNPLLTVTEDDLQTWKKERDGWLAQNGLAGGIILALVERQALEEAMMCYMENKQSPTHLPCNTASVANHLNGLKACLATERSAQNRVCQITAMIPFLNTDVEKEELFPKLYDRLSFACDATTLRLKADQNIRFSQLVREATPNFRITRVIFSPHAVDICALAERSMRYARNVQQYREHVLNPFMESLSQIAAIMQRAGNWSSEDAHNAANRAGVMCLEIFDAVAEATLRNVPVNHLFHILQQWADRRESDIRPVDHLVLSRAILACMSRINLKKAHEPLRVS